MNDLTVEVNGLRLFAHHGVGEQERKVGNLFEVTVHLRYPADGAIADDRLEDTLNYAEAVAVVREVMTVPSQLCLLYTSPSPRDADVDIECRLLL